jgi:hypothetical protein
MNIIIFKILSWVLIIFVLSVFIFLIYLILKRDKLIKTKIEAISINEMFAFTEWVGKYYIRSRGFWINKLQDQNIINNYITTEQLYKLWKKINI